MVQRFKVVTVDFQDYATDLIGISKDAYISKLNSTSGYGACTIIEVSSAAGSNERLGLIEITMPDDGDLPEADAIMKIELGLYLAGIGGGTGPVAIYEMNADQEWDENSGCPISNPATWQYAQPLIEWANYTDHSQIYSDDEVALDSLYVFISNFFWFDLTRSLGFGTKKNFFLRCLDAVGPKLEFVSRDASLFPLLRPILRITYKDYPPEAFTDDDSYLKINPNPDNPEEPKLTWGKVSDPGFLAYKVYRKTTSFTLPSQATLISTINDPNTNTFIDTSALSENQDYYYMVTVEDNENTGDSATMSALVSFKRPTCTHSEATETIDVGDLVTVTLNSSIQCKRAYIEWGDAVDGYWIESEIEVTQFVLTHRYSETGAKVVKARLESSDGYWSDLDTVCTKTLDDKPPEDVLIVRPLEVVTGESVRCIGRKSQPVASDALISQYDYWVNGTWQINKGPVFDVIPTSDQEILLRIFTDTGESYQQVPGEGETITIVSGEPTLLEFSKDTTINSRAEGRESDAEVMGIVDGIGEIDIPYGIKNRVYSITGLSARSDFKADIDLIRDRQESQEYTRILVIDEKEGITVQLDGRLSGYRITQTTRTYVTWSFGFRVFRISRAIESITYDGVSGKMKVSSTSHGLFDGYKVKITGTVNYNGEYVIEADDPDYFVITHANDGDEFNVGSWSH